MKRVVYLLMFIAFFFISLIGVKAYKEYSVGEKITYNDIDFYVIKNSSSESDSIVLLKAEPLTVDEVNLYGGVGTDNNHVNMHTKAGVSYVGEEIYYQTARDVGGYGVIQYYGSSDCGYYSFLDTYISSNCKNSYLDSEIKYVIDAWANANINDSDLKEARLISYDEYAETMETRQICTGSCYEGLASKYDWMYIKNYWSWIGTPYNDSSTDVWVIYGSGTLGNTTVHDSALVRPVIELKKSAIEKSENSIIDNNNDTVNKKEQSVISVVVPNTIQVMSLFFSVVGIVLILIGIVLVIKKKISSKKNR